jgi:hypothetical protein
VVSPNVSRLVALGEVCWFMMVIKCVRVRPPSLRQSLPVPRSRSGPENSLVVVDTA